MLNLTNGNRKAILSLAQLAWVVGVSFGLGQIWNDVRVIRLILREGVYTKAEVNKLHMDDAAARLALSRDLSRLEGEVSSIRGTLNGVRIQTSK